MRVVGIDAGRQRIALSLRDVSQDEEGQLGENEDGETVQLNETQKS